MHVKAFLLAEAARGIAPATRNSALFALRSFYEYLRSEDLIDTNPTATIKVPGARKLRTEIYTDAEADLMLAWVGDQPGKRGRVGYAVLATLRWTGLRRNEISMLRLDDVDLDARRISLVGKGDKARIVPIAPPLVPILDDYLTSLRPALAKSAFFFVNPSAHHGGRYEGRYGPMTVAKLVQRAGTGAGVSGRHFPHRWRHSYATEPAAPGGGHPRRPAPPRPLQHRHDHALPAPLRRRPGRRRGQGVPRRVGLLPQPHLGVGVEQRLERPPGRPGPPR